jgi:putative membrane protein
MFRKFAVGLAVASVCSLGVAAWAQAQSGSNPEPSRQEPKSKKLSEADKRFMESASHGNLREIALGQLAMKRAQSDPVKTYAAKVVADHTKAEDGLKALAAKRDVKLSTKVDTSKTPMARLESAPADKFDAEYLDYIIKEHEKDVAEFKHQSEAAADPDLKVWVIKTLPMLEHHLDEARELERKAKEPAAPAMVP